MVIAMGATSCSDPRTYDHYKSVSLQGWSRKDTLTFDIPRQWEGNYQLDLCLRAAQTYPYRNISMIIEQKVIYYRQRKKREKTYNDTVNCEIINDKDSMQVKIHHIMGRESLPGISDIGVRLIKE